jgi:phage terminase large subunit-like protein
MVTAPGGTVVRWPNGSEAKLFGANTEPDTERLRSGGNRCLAWLEEMAAWRYLDSAWAQMRFGLRSGPRPHWIASTTPKPRPLIKKLASGGFNNVVLSRASMYDNPHLQEDIRQALEEEYANTDLGRQELHAEVLDEDSNALWTRTALSASRLLLPDVPRLTRITVGVDPSGGAGEQGVVVVGKSMVPREHDDPRKRVPLAHGYVLADRTCHLRPEGWGRRAVEAAVEFEADDICVEINFGGDMAVSTIRAAADIMGVNIPIKVTRATRSKQVRAQPVSALTAQNRFHMVGTHPELEDQLCTWYPELDWSPDRLDAMVWPAWHNKIVKMTATGDRTPGGMSQMSRAIG